MLNLQPNNTSLHGIHFAVLFCVVLGFVSSSRATTKASTNRPLINVRAESIARTDKLTLGDIASISNADSATLTQLQNISLGYAPEVGMIRQITREKISLALAAAGFSSASVDIQAAAQALVRRESQLIDLAQVRAAVEQATLPELRARGASAQLVRLDLPRTLEVKTGAVELRASAGNIRNWFVPFTVSIEVWIDQRIARRLTATAQIEATTSVIVAQADLADKTRLTPKDFKSETIRLECDLRTYVLDPVQLRGMTLAKPVAKGEPITTDLLVPGIVVRPGDVVQIVTDSNRLKISLTGEARAAGHVGDRIQVKNLQSGLMVQATVVDEGIVKVRF